MKGSVFSLFFSLSLFGNIQKLGSQKHPHWVIRLERALSGNGRDTGRRETFSMYTTIVGVM